MVKKLINDSRQRKSKDIWLYVKQLWYIPFIWSLAWFSYWIFHEIIVLNQPLFQVDTLNCYGVAISILALLIAGYIYGRSRKKQIEKASEVGIEAESVFISGKALDEKRHQESRFSQKNLYITQEEKLEQLELQPRNHSPIDTYQIQKPNDMGSESKPTPSIISTIPSQANLPNLTEKSQDIPFDCLICPKLAKCDQRQKRTIEPGVNCPYAQSNSH